MRMPQVDYYLQRSACVKGQDHTEHQMEKRASEISILLAMGCVVSSRLACKADFSDIEIEDLACPLKLYQKFQQGTNKLDKL